MNISRNSENVAPQGQMVCYVYFFSCLVYDECGVCGGSGPADHHDCDGNCISSGDCGEASLSFTNATDSSVDVMYNSTVDLVVSSLM